jgi:hypothetical protein
MVFGLLMVAAPTLWHLAEPRGWAARCHGLLADLAPGGPVVGWSALVVAVVLVGRLGGLAVATRRRNRRACVEPPLGHHLDRGDYELVTLPTTEVVAFGVGSPPQVIISQGLIDSLTPEAVGAVERHEAAHLRLHHDRYLLVATVIERAFGWLAPVQRSALVLRSALEQWADDIAVGRGATPDALSGAFVDVASARQFGESSGPAEPVSVLERAVRLSVGTPSRRPRAASLLYAPGILLVLASVVVSFGWLTSAGRVLAASGYCPG